jgi:antitoxin component of RelBE/YafQ-DinJ toxin-antitoxin module
MQDYYTPAQPHQMPANLNRPPWNLFLSHPPISSAHILEMESSELYRRRPQLTRIRVYAHKGITFGDVMSMMTARRCLDTDMPFMVVLGSEAETLRAAEEFIRRVGEQVSERLQRRRRGGVDEMRSILVVIKRPRADYPQGSVIIARVCGTGLGKRPCM